MRRLVLAAVLTLGLAAPARAGLDEAVAALEGYDYPAAYREFLVLAESGDPIAQYYLGYMYYYGLAVPANYGKAYEWMRRSAEQGDSDAQTFIGDLFYDGEGVPQDFARAAYWYARAAKQGHPYARYSLALMRIDGEGGARDPEAAVAALRTLAEEGLADAQRSLAHLYESGNGVPQDMARAREWYRTAAEQGDVFALGDLGRIYAEGIGVDRDLPQAYVWWSLAAANAASGWDHAVRRRDEIAAQLTSARLAEAQAMASRWRPDVAERFLDGTLGDWRSFAKAALGLAVPELSAELELESSGTGFVISGANHVLTSHHVVEDCAEIRVAEIGGGSAPARIAGSDRESDLAILQRPGRAADYARFRAGWGVRQGEGLVVLGFPLRGILGTSLNVSTGIVSALAEGDAREMQISSPVQAGNSGSPVLDLSGNVIGVVTSKLDALEIEAVIGDLPQNVNFAVAPTAVLGVLEASGVAISTAASDRAVAVSDIVDRARRFTVLVECWN